MLEYATKLEEMAHISHSLIVGLEYAPVYYYFGTYLPVFTNETKGVKRVGLTY